MKGIIFIFGPPGAGKLTIAKEVCKNIPDARLIHSHLINNVIFEIARPEYGRAVDEIVWESVRGIRNIVFNTILKLKNVDACVFTNVLMKENDASARMYEEVKKLAKKKKLGFFPVRLTISKNEWRRRILSNERASFMKQQFITSEDMKAFQGGVFIPYKDDYLDLNVTNLTAQESARKILHWIRDDK